MGGVLVEAHGGRFPGVARSAGPPRSIVGLIAASACRRTGNRRNGAPVADLTRVPARVQCLMVLLSSMRTALMAKSADACRSSLADFRARRILLSSELLSKVRSLKQFGHCI